jgi:hypothetical protein
MLTLHAVHANPAMMPMTRPRRWVRICARSSTQPLRVEPVAGGALVRADVVTVAIGAPGVSRAGAVAA